MIFSRARKAASLRVENRFRIAFSFSWRLAARCAHQILSTPFANRRQILLAHHPTIHHPDAPCLTVLTLYHAQDRFHGGHVGTVAIERFIAERKSLAVA